MDEVLEGVVMGNEVGFGVDFNDNSFVVGGSDIDEVFSSCVVWFFVGFGNVFGV